MEAIPLAPANAVVLPLAAVPVEWDDQRMWQALKRVTDIRLNAVPARDNFYMAHLCKDAFDGSMMATKLFRARKTVVEQYGNQKSFRER